MEQITEVIIHCSATKEGVDYRMADIDRWHRAKGWNGCGYHYVIDLDGSIEIGRRLPLQGAHCTGHNAHSIGICYIGGLDANGKPKDTRTKGQRTSLRALIETIRFLIPSVSIHGHRDFAAKACPCFDVQQEYK